MTQYNQTWLPDMFARILNPVPQKRTVTAQRYRFDGDVTIAVRGVDDIENATLWPILVGDIERLITRKVRRTDGDADITLVLRDGPRSLPDEGYGLRVCDRGVELVAEDMAGLFYGCQTLAQLIWLERGEPTVQHTDITDYPAHANRWLMVDCGRAIFSLDLLKRVVRVASRLKYNGIHLHLSENEINPVRYRDLPHGSENPYAITVADYGKLIEYAADYHMETLVEVESWGHAGSLLQHSPELYGASRPHGYGHAFGVGPQTFEFLGKVYDEWMEVMPSGSRFHVGGDEANWYFFDGVDREKYNRDTLVERLHETLQASARNAGKDVTMHFWGGGVKHGDLKMPQELRNQIVMYPWAYRNAAGVREQMMRHWIRDIKRYDTEGRLQSPFINGAGTTGTHNFGCILATQCFAELGLSSEFPNCLGMLVMNWASNSVSERLLPYYHGGGASWNPHGSAQWLDYDRNSLNEAVEDKIGLLASHMRQWQASFPDADPVELDRDRGPEVLMGRWRWGEQQGEPVVPIWMPENLRRGDQDK